MAVEQDNIHYDTAVANTGTEYPPEGKPPKSENSNV